MSTDRSSGINPCKIADTPIAVLDFETTGLSAGSDRVVEMSLVRIDPGSAPRLVFDTLINPNRSMGATDIHGITETDVAGAPTFDEVGDYLSSQLAGCVVTAYNAYFDIRFLEYELGSCGQAALPPYFCLMYLRPMLGIGKRSTLADACRQHGITTSGTHHSASDTLAAAELWGVCLDAMHDQGVETFADLGSLKKYKFVDSFTRPVLRDSQPRPGAPRRTKSRSGFRVSGVVDRVVTPRPELSPRPSISPRPPVSVAKFNALTDQERSASREYWEHLKIVLYDLQVTQHERDEMLRKQVELKMNDGQIRALHARAFVSVITHMLQDKRLDYKESDRLKRVGQCLRDLGWCPGD